MFVRRLKELNWSKWLKNTGLFITPVVLLYFVFVQNNMTDGFETTDFVPTKEVIGAMVLYVINVIIDLLKKFLNTK